MRKTLIMAAMLACSVARSENTPASPDSENAGFVVVSTSNAEIIKGLSPYNWVRTPDFICSATMGASLKAAFSGTKTVILKVDTSYLQYPSASRYPVLAWSVNQGPIQTHQLVAGEKSIVLSSNVANPGIDLYIKGMSPFENRYKGDVPADSVKITGFNVDKGGTVLPTNLPNKYWLNIGDSIMSGDGAGCAKAQGRPANDAWAASGEARASYGYLLAEHYGYRESRLAYGGYAWSGGRGGMGGVPPLSQLIDQITSTVSRLTGSALDPKPDVVLINLGENGTPAASVVTQTLAKIRSRVGNAKIIMMIPLSGKGRKELTDAFNAYISPAQIDKNGVSAGANTYLVDLGKITYDTAEGQHPTAAGHHSVYLSALPKFDAILQSKNTP